MRMLAEWGREFDKERRKTRAPVIVLTATELFTPHRLEEVWKQKGGMHNQMMGPAYIQLDRLKTMADFTQQLYLGMPSYAAWREEKCQKIKTLIEKRKAAQPPFPRRP